MDVRCERCKVQYQVDEAGIPPVGLALQCTQCGHVFLVKKKELVVTVPVKPGTLTGAPVPASAAGRLTGQVPATPSPAATPAAAPAPAHEDPASEWRVRLVTGEIFPCRDVQTLQKWVVERRIGREDEVAPPGQSYKKLRELPELDTFFEVVDAADRAPAPAPPPPPAAPAAPPRRTATRATAVSTPMPPDPPPASFDVDIHGDGDLDAAERAALGGGHGLRNTLLVIGALAVIVAGVWVLAPGLFAPVVALFQPAAPPPPPAEVVAPAGPAPTAPAPAAPEPPAQEPPKPSEPPPAAADAAAPSPDAATPAPAAPAPAAAPRTPKQLVAAAERLRMRGELEKALDLYDRAAEADPDNADALAGRGLCYLDLEQYEAASTAFRETLRVDPEHADALLGAAEAARSLGRTADAIKHYQKYLEAYPEGEEAPVARNALEELRR